MRKTHTNVFDLTNVYSYYINSEKFKNTLIESSLEDKLKNIVFTIGIDEINFKTGETSYSGKFFLYHYSIGRYLIALNYVETKMIWKQFYPYDFLDYYDKKFFQENFNYFGTLAHYLVISFSLNKIVQEENFSKNKILEWESQHYPFFVSNDRVAHLKRVIYDRIEKYIERDIKKVNLLDDIPLILEYRIVKDYLIEKNVPLNYLDVDFVRKVESSLNF